MIRALRSLPFFHGFVLVAASLGLGACGDDEPAGEDGRGDGDGDGLPSAFLYQGGQQSVTAASFDGARVHGIHPVTRDGEKLFEVVAYRAVGVPETVATAPVGPGVELIVSSDTTTFWAFGSPAVVSAREGDGEPTTLATLDGQVQLVGAAGDRVWLIHDGSAHSMAVSDPTMKPVASIRGIGAFVRHDGTVFAPTPDGIVRIEPGASEGDVVVDATTNVSLVADDTHVFWIDGLAREGTVSRAPIDGGATESLGNGVDAADLPQKLWIHDDHVYAQLLRAGLLDGVLARRPKSGGAWELVDLRHPFETWDVHVRPGSDLFAVHGTVKEGAKRNEVLLLLPH